MSTVDDFLKAQDVTPSLGVIERIPGDEAIVKITPWTKGGGCNCNAALTVKKAAIRSLVSTEFTHDCCGKTLKVVELQFNDGAAVSVNDLFQERRAASIAAHESNVRNSQVGQQVRPMQQSPCLPGSHLCSYNGSTWCCPNGLFCANYLNGCTSG